MKALTDEGLSRLKEYIERAEELGNSAKEKGVKFEAYAIITANEKTTFSIKVGGEHLFAHIANPLGIDKMFEDAEKAILDEDSRKKARIEELRAELAKLEGNE